MDRPPYPIRVAAGIVVTVLEETRKLPMAAITLPMTAVSNTVARAMQLQQNIAEMAIKGDEVFDALFPNSQEQPEWATFDEDDEDELFGQIESLTERLTAAAEKNDGSWPNLDEPVGNASDTDEEGRPGAAPAVANPPPPKKAPAKKAPAKKVAKKAPAKKAPAKKAPAKKAAKKIAPGPADNGVATGSASVEPDQSALGTGRFALYSSAPADLAPTATPAADSAGGDAPEVVDVIDYDSLTLAQLRAKLKTVSPEDYPALAAYERRTKNRAPFVTMIDNRIAASNK